MATWDDTKKAAVLVEIGELIENGKHGDNKLLTRGGKTWTIANSDSSFTKFTNPIGVVGHLLKQKYGVLGGCLFCESHSSNFKEHLRKYSCPHHDEFAKFIDKFKILEPF